MTSNVDRVRSISKTFAWIPYTEIHHQFSNDHEYDTSIATGTRNWCYPLLDHDEAKPGTRRPIPWSTPPEQFTDETASPPNPTSSNTPAAFPYAAKSTCLSNATSRRKEETITCSDSLFIHLHSYCPHPGEPCHGINSHTAATATATTSRSYPLRSYIGCKRCHADSCRLLSTRNKITKNQSSDQAQVNSARQTQSFQE